MIKISDLKLNSTVDMFLFIKNIEEKITSNKSTFIQCILSDGENEILGKMWNVNKEKIESNGINSCEIVKVRGVLNSWDNKEYFKIDLIRNLKPEDNVSLNVEDFIKKAPIGPQEMFDYIVECSNKFENEDLKKLTLEILNQYKAELMCYAGAQKVHHNIQSGLLYHTYRMLLSGERLADIYIGLNRDLLFSGIILHDIGKVLELDSDENGNVEDFTKEGKLLGHILQGIKIVTIASYKFGISEEISSLIEHIIASHHYDETMGSFKKPMTIEAELVHHLDVIDARLYMIEEINNNLEENSFSKKEFFLGNRQIYKPQI